MGGLDSSIVAAALPTIRKGLHARLAWAGWTITAYQLGQVLALPISGRISDQFGVVVFSHLPRHLHALVGDVRVVDEHL